MKYRVLIEQDDQTGCTWRMSHEDPVASRIDKPEKKRTSDSIAAYGLEAHTPFRRQSRKGGGGYREDDVPNELQSYRSVPRIQPGKALAVHPITEEVRGM